MRMNELFICKGDKIFKMHGNVVIRISYQTGIKKP